MAEMTELAREKCETLLRSHQVGRVAVHDHAGLLLFPVNYVFDGAHVAIRCEVGSRLAASVQQTVAFEIDDISEQTKTGWSVVVVGTAYDISDAVDGDSTQILRTEMESWAPGAKGCWIRIEPNSITGRRVSAS